MSKSYWIIDGYNALHAAGLARSHYGPGDLSRQRQRLLAQLASRLTTEERTHCTIVFDAIEAPPNLPHRQLIQGLTVLFAPPGHEADELIESLIAAHSVPRRLTVVSSDHRLQTAIRRRRGTAIDSELYLRQLESPHRHVGTPGPAKTAARPDARVSGDAETDFWQRQFEDVDPQSLVQELADESKTPQDAWQNHLEELQRQLKDPDVMKTWLEPPDRRS